MSEDRDIIRTIGPSPNDVRKHLAPPDIPLWHGSPASRWMAEDLREARALQNLWLDRKVAGLDGLELATGFRPAARVRGDIFELFECGDGRMVATLGDASGRNAAAALYGAVVSGLVSTLAESTCRPAQLLRALNEALLQRRVETQSVSLLALSWHPAHRRLMLASAGANRPLVRRRTEVRVLELGGAPLGLLKNWEYDEALLELEPRDVIVWCSDGISEQENAAGQQYDGRAAQVLRDNGHKSPEALVDAIFADLDRFAGAMSEERSDDQTVAVFKIT